MKKTQSSQIVINLIHKLKLKTEIKFCGDFLPPSFHYWYNDNWFFTML